MFVILEGYCITKTDQHLSRDVRYLAVLSAQISSLLKNKEHKIYTLIINFICISKYSYVTQILIFIEANFLMSNRDLIKQVA